jgi:hypothetical protein
MIHTAKLAISVVLILGLAGCGGFRDSRLNPLNWFKRPTSEATSLEPKGGYEAGDNRALVAEVTALEVSAMPGGAIVNAVGLPPTQGWWDAELVPDNFGDPVDGVMTYRFKIAEPRWDKRAGTPQSREVTAAAFLTDLKLQEISEIVVVGERNQRSVRR